MTRLAALTSLLTVLGCSQPAESPPPTQTSPAESPAAAAPVAPELGVDEPGVDESGYYGVYLNGHKVGWMHTKTTEGERVELLVELRASVGGLGTVSKIELDEKRTYIKATGALESLSFAQRAATGSVLAKGTVADGKLALDITAGGRTTTQHVDVAESLSDALATVDLAKAGKVGSTKTAKRFDASIQKLVTIHHKVVAAETRVFAGVESETVKIESRYPELGITETAWLDRSGTVFESKVGGFFVARLEPPDVAKRLDFSQDLLISAVVKAPPGVQAATDAKAMELSFKGFGELTPPDSPRQRVKKAGDTIRLSLTRDPPLEGALPSAVGTTGDEYLAATPFIQSDDQALRSRAKKVIGDAADLRVATERLTHFVYSHVRDEYVPAYSNALEALDSGRGDCTEHSILFVAMARSLGIPARVAVGIAYWGAGGGFGWHAWAEVRDGKRWVAVDPTWDQPVADVTHVKLADGGPAQQARIVMLLGQLSIVDAKVGG